MELQGLLGGLAQLAGQESLQVYVGRAQAGHIAPLSR
jgi:hypothetical protein